MALASWNAENTLLPNTLKRLLQASDNVKKMGNEFENVRLKNILILI